MSNLHAAAAAFVQTKFPNETGIVVENIYIETEHRSGDGCSSCGYDCEYSSDLDIHYRRDITNSAADEYWKGRGLERVSDLWSTDNSKDHTEFFEFLASWVPNTELPNV